MDTAGKPNFAPADSVMLATSTCPGTIRHCEGERITFDANSRATKVTDKAMVLRDSQLVKSDTIGTWDLANSARGQRSREASNVFVGRMSAHLHAGYRHVRHDESQSPPAAG